MTERLERNGEQLLLPFDFWEEEEKAEQKKFSEKVAELRTYQKPENDNQRLFNLQKAHYSGNRGALGEMFIILVKVAARLVNREMHSRRLRFTQEKIDELSVDAAAKVVEQIRKNDLMIETSFVAYLRLQVLKVMFGRTKAERFAKYCQRNGIDLFLLDDGQKQSLKRRFENRRVNHERGNKTSGLYLSSDSGGVL